jgi:uncharacterized protein YkwD
MFLHGCTGATIAAFPSMFGQVNRYDLTAAICIVGIISTSAPFAAATTRPTPASKVLADVVRLTNAERAIHKRSRLRTNARLMRAAQIQADQMARAGQQAHVLPGAPYPNAEDRLAAAGYDWQSYGENLAFGQRNSAEAVRSWMHSRGHRANIISPAFTELGVGYAVDRAGRPYYVQVFANPLSSS